MDTDKVARNIIRMRDELGLNQSELAQKLNTSQVRISQIESGKFKSFPLDLIDFYYKEGLSMDYLFSGTGVIRRTDSIEKKIDNSIDVLKKRVETYNSQIILEIENHRKTMKE